MHELAICQALIQQLETISRAHQQATIAVVHLQMGPLSGVVPALLADAFPIASAGTSAQDALLKITEGPLRVRCSTCGAETDARINKLICGACGDWHTTLISGDELLLERVELDVDDS
ncbi:hydrogenase maturation nickel metallochaperone HypA/HybF [Candidatus Venteria ishoeyi]|uniref:Hydrogenase maturation factor HypA n=2 Tax=Candidatus Venteria ishoeyi TaxID=1899563 RepID=A0A1H6F8H9_9GAMM|nr:hydrogenase maturation nickel metallochaperone HypA [Candidatus Venteria ishoeyi]MDM8547030.1 hydrogenase maturation nickel metallochaperone HypA [Candidatus Venteria ishoeyi]SEH06437.1 hydrogenase nickel incorporation protein [Candidatus Venteria ishoeyi]